MKSNKAPAPAQTVADIFDAMGEPEARRFIGAHVHPIDPRWNRNEIVEFLGSQSYGIHKDLATYAEVAVEKFNARS